MKFPSSYKVFRRYLLSVVFIFFTLLSSAQIQILGSSEGGGSDQLGTLFSIVDDGSSFEINSEFINNPEGAAPRSALLEVEPNRYVGATSSGGINGGGTFFEIQNGAFTKIFDFNPSIHGSNNQSTLVNAGNSQYILANASGGPSGSGVLLRVSLTGDVEVLYNFSGSTEGSNPRGNLALDETDNILYGACSNGGAAGFGTIFSYDLNTDDFSVIHVFQGAATGAYPQGGVTLGIDGLLYGTTQAGGEFSQGAIFAFNPQNQDYEVIYDLNNVSSDGRFPFSSLIQTSAGLLVGTCSEGGTGGTGTVFSCSTSGNFTRLHSFSASVHGGFPKSGLVEGSDGLLYGVTEFGANNGFGSLYSIDEAGNFTKLYDMEYTASGSNPVGKLIATTDGSILGGARSGGANNFGTIFRYQTGSVEKVHDFSLPLGGSAPRGLIFDGAAFYGVTATGGDFNTGVFYSADLSGNRNKIYDFEGTLDGQNPNGELLLLNGAFYGTARFGGENQSGTIYSLTPEGDFELLHAFEGGDGGEFPHSGLCLHNDGWFYGTTISGGMFGDGILYRIDEEGNFEKLHDFFGFFDGASPQAGLTEANEGKLYGVTEEGGTANAGTIFEYDPSATSILVVQNFDNSTGTNPLATLLLHSDEMLYGATSEGGDFGGGTIFSYSFTEGLTLLHHFDPSTNGFRVEGALVEDILGKVYGFCNQGGANSAGTLFTYEETFEKIYDFSTITAANPTGSPVLFYPECLDDSDCVSANPCAVGICNFGECEEVSINPVFEIVEIGLCDNDLYDLIVNLNLDISPGDSIVIANDTLVLSETVNSYTFTLTNLPANGEPIQLDYEFMATGCTGISSNLGDAPVPCPPIETTFRIDVGNLEVNPDGIHLGGNFQGWTPSELPLAEVEPGLWETTLEINAGSYEFNFFNGSSLFDGEYVVGDCANNGKRQLEVEDESQILEFCWEICGSSCFLSANGSVDPSNVSIYPNPVRAGELVTLEYSKHAYRYRIVDLNGRTISEGASSGHQTTIQTQNLSSGYYAVLITSDGGALIPAGSFVVR